MHIFKTFTILGLTSVLLAPALGCSNDDGAASDDDDDTVEDSGAGNSDEDSGSGGGGEPSEDAGNSGETDGGQGAPAVDGGEAADAGEIADANAGDAADAHVDVDAAFGDAGVTGDAAAASDGGETVDGGEAPTVTSDNGVITAVSGITPAEGSAAFTAAVDANPFVGLGATVDHQANAAGLDPAVAIPPATLFAFGNPDIGTPLMVENPLAGLDLPLRMLVWEDAEGGQFVSYEGTAYLKARHGLETVDTQLMTAMNALAGLASEATGMTVAPQPGDATGIERGEGIRLTLSNNDAVTTLSRLTAAIEANPVLSIAGSVDHQANAVTVNRTMGFSTVVWLANPAAGTPLIEAQPRIGLDLPMKALVAETEIGTVIAYNDPAFLAAKHDLDADTAMMATALQALANEAAAAAE